MSDLIDVTLSDDERLLLRSGLNEWGGPARCTEEMAVAIGFDSKADFSRQRRRLRQAIEEGRPLSAADWSRALIATEIVFASDVIGSGLDWSITTGIPDAEAISLLRSVQRKMPRWRASWQFTRGEGGGVQINDPDRPVPGGE